MMVTRICCGKEFTNSHGFSNHNRMHKKAMKEGLMTMTPKLIPRKKLIEIDLLLEDMLQCVKSGDLRTAKRRKEEIYTYLEMQTDKPCPECKSTNGYHPAECSWAMIL